ncbi:MAG: peptidylprolyl isomerase [Deltaproteobacteria bacterium]
MLDNMRAASSSAAGKLVMALLFGLLSVAFAISFGPGSRGCEGLRTGADYAAKVNGEIITQTEFERYYYRRVRQFGEMDRALVDQYFPRSRALDELVKDRLVADEAKRHGIDVGDAELRDVIVKDPSFQDDGKFSKERYGLVLERSLGMTEDTFEDQLRRDLRVQKMSAVIRETAKVTDSELERKFRDENEKVDLAFVRFSPAFYAKDVSASDAEITAYEKAHAQELQAAYDKESYRFHAPRRVQARRLLVKVAQGASPADDAKAKAAIEAARATVQGGADFGKLIRELSQASDAKSGGEIGTIREGGHLFDPALEKAALALDEGKLSPPTRSAQGWELVQAEKVLPAEDKGFEQVKADLAKEAVTREKEDALAKAAAAAAQQQLAAGGSLEKLFPPAAPDEPDHKFAPPPNHPISDHTGLFARSSVGYVPKLGQSAELQRAAFALTKEGATTPAPTEIQDAYVVVQLREHDQPNPADFAKKKDELRENAQRTSEVQLMESWRNKLRQQAIVEINPAVIAPPSRG